VHNEGVSAAISEGELDASLSDRGLARGVRGLVWAWVFVVGVGVLAASLAYTAAGQVDDALLKPILAAPVVIGAIVAVRKPRHPIGWMFIVGGSAGFVSSAIEDGRFAWAGHGRGAGSAWLMVAGDALWPLTFPLLAAALLWFPDGRLPSVRWRAVAVATGAAITLAVIGSIVAPWRTSEGGPRNPLAVPLVDGVFPIPVVNAALPLLTIAAFCSVPVRYRGAPPAVRSSLRWVLWAAVVSVCVVGGLGVASIFFRVPEVVNGAAPGPIVVGVPVCVGIGVLQDRLFDIDLLLNRTLLYASLTIVILATYLGAVGFSSQVLGWHDNAPALAAGLVVALVFHPVRVAAQRAADRWLFGDRRDPLAVLAAVSGSTTEEPGSFDGLAQAIATSLRLHHVAIDVVRPAGSREAPDSWDRLGVSGTVRGADLVEMPVERSGQVLGRLVVATRARRDPLRGDELALLAAIAEQIAATLQTTQLAAAVQRSREQIVQAAEEERRRLRRDLHDGLGSRLAGIGYTIEAASRTCSDLAPAHASYPAELLSALHEAKGELVEASAELRRVIDDLRPAALDDLGLPEALASAAARILDSAGVACDLTTAMGPNVGPLPAATEVAIFRIGIEAVTNVARHARASCCHIDLAASPADVVLTVTDDGVGPQSGPAYHRDGGVGMLSMAERAAQLGGIVSVAAGREGGTIVRARLPVGDAA
jgi:two-component system NarL family sensor kinase